jgi:Zn-dependent protease with chaperone function
MNWFNEIEKLKGKPGVILVLFDLLFLISPGIAVIFFYDPTLFISLDWARLTLLSIAIITPFVILNSFISLIFIETQGKEKEPEKSVLFGSFFIGVVSSGFSIYICLFISYFFGKSLIDVASSLCILELLALAVAYYKDYKHERAKKSVKT